MKKKYHIYRLILSFMLIMSFILPAHAQIGVNIDIQEGYARINGNSNYIKEAVSIKIEDEGKKKWMNTDITDNKGNFSFTLPSDVLEAQKKYDGFVNISGEKKTFEILKNAHGNKPKPTKYKIGERVAIKSVKSLIFDNGVEIHLNNINVPQSATVKLRDVSSEFSDSNASLKKAGPIIDFDFKNIKFDQPVEITMPAKGNIQKSAIYYYNEAKKNWEYKDTQRTNNMLKARVNHFSTYGVLMDQKVPENVQVKSEEISKEKIRLNFSAEDASGIDHYIIYRDNFSSAFASSKANIYEDKQVESGKTYIYKIKAVDKLGNKSNFSNTLEVAIPKDGSIVAPSKKSIKVDIRIEGNKGTIIDKTKVYLSESDLDLNQYNIDRSYEDYTVIHPTVKILEQQGVRYGFDKKYNYNFINMIDGLRMNSIKPGKDGWMYFINHKYADRGLSEYPIHDGDSIVWFFTEDYTKNHFAWFDQEEAKVSTGDKITLSLQGRYHNMNSGQSSTKGIEGATILVNNNKWKSNEGFVKTDKDGKATITFNRAGTYQISAEKFDGSSRCISRPYCKVIVEGETVSDGGAGGLSPDSDYKKEYEKVIDPNASEKDIIKATEEATNKLDKKVNDINSEKDAQDAVKDIKDVTQIIEKASERVTTEEGAKDVAKGSAKLVNDLIKSAEKLIKDSDKKEVSKAATENIKVTMKVMDKINNTKEMNKVAGQMIDVAGKLIKTLGNKNGKEVIESIVKVAEKAVEKASVKEIDKDKIKVEKEKIVAKVDKVTIKEMAKNTVATVKAIKEKLKENGIETKQAIENKVTIGIPKTDKKEIEAKLPANMMKILKENGIEKAAIKTETAVFNLTPNTFGEKDQAISLGVKQIDRNTLTPLERNKVPKGCMVVDLDVKIGEEKVSNFNEPISVSIPYKGEVKDGEGVQVFFLKDNGTIENRGGVYDPATKMATFTTPHFSKYFAKKIDKTEAKITFKDLENYGWAKEAIEAMATKGIVSGRSNEKFDPAANITRAEFATLVTKMMGYTTENMDMPFTDVDKDAWYYDYIGAAYKNGLINGRSETLFDPNGNITRQEMAVIVAKVLEKKGYKKSSLDSLNVFKDTENISAWAKDSVSLCVKEKIISGMGDGSFAPKQNANRAQAATMLYKVYQLIVK
ncbi:MAG: S-layer homology domain-containing protein [Marinisporobacter sp.]|jgi:plastocyanin|nr:S-layer homology domain-containing protein [Marinisporobacter sp.]